MQYAGKARCPRCQTTLVHEYECTGDCLPLEALEQAEQRLVCPACGYTRHVAYVVPRPSQSEIGLSIKQWPR